MTNDLYKCIDDAIYATVAPFYYQPADEKTLASMNRQMAQYLPGAIEEAVRKFNEEHQYCVQLSTDKNSVEIKSRVILNPAVL